MRTATHAATAATDHGNGTAHEAAGVVVVSEPKRTPEVGGADRIIPLGAIVPSPYQPRRQFDPADLERLAASMQVRQLQAIVVRPLPPAAERQKAKKLAEQFAQRLGRWKVVWLQQRIVERLSTAPDADAMVLRLLLHFAVQDTRQRGSDTLLKAIAFALAGAKVRSDYGRFDALRPLLAVPAAKLPLVARAAINQWVAMPTDTCYSHLTPADVEALADALGVDVKRDWQLTEGYLQLHNTAQLLALCKEWAIPADLTAGLKRGDLIAAILKRDPKACPREVLTVKGCR